MSARAVFGRVEVRAVRGGLAMSRELVQDALARALEDLPSEVLAALPRRRLHLRLPPPAAGCGRAELAVLLRDALLANRRAGTGGEAL